MANGNKVKFLFFISLVLFIIFNVNLIYAQNTDICENQEKNWQIDKCYADTAIELNDVSLCKKSKEYSGNCYYQIAIKLDDISLCNEADKFKSDCYRAFAIKTGDFSLPNLT